MINNFIYSNQLLSDILMIKNYQLHDYGCFQACLSSILEVNIQDIPDFYADGEENFYLAWKEWNDANGGYKLLDILYNEDILKTNREDFFIVTGTSPRDCDMLHSVIYKDGILAHDPYKPDQSGILNPFLITLITYL